MNIHVFLYMFWENQVFEEDNGWKGILGRTWVDLVAKKSPTWHPNRSQHGVKMASKNGPKLKSVSDRS